MRVMSNMSTEVGEPVNVLRAVFRTRSASGQEDSDYMITLVEAARKYNLIRRQKWLR